MDITRDVTHITLIEPGEAHDPKPWKKAAAQVWSDLQFHAEIASQQFRQDSGKISLDAEIGLSRLSLN